MNFPYLMMRADIYTEPELEFGIDKHIDIRFGLMNYYPLDFESPLAPKNIRLGLVGTTESIEGISNWIDRCRDEIASKESRQPNLFPRFPGFNQDNSFHSSLVIDGQLSRFISEREFENLSSITNLNDLIIDAVDLYLDEIKYLSQTTNSDVIVCAIPNSLLDLMEYSQISDDDSDYRLDFHNLLKAKSMHYGVPTQIVLPATYGGKKRITNKASRLQDEATRAWNFHTALYYKSGGKPWRLIREPKDYTTCYVGVGFYKSLDQKTVLSSVAQVFNERGDGLIIRGGVAKVSKADRQPHLDKNGSYELLRNSLDTYRREHKTLPARVAVHKTSMYTDEELDGYLNSVNEFGIELIDLVSIAPSLTRLYRNGAYPAIRGTFIEIDENHQILYTRGSVEFFKTYPGLYIPKPIIIRCAYKHQTSKFIGHEILALTKMNWNNTQFDGRLPITIRAARQVGAILKNIEQQEITQPKYSFYM
ncbi:hypothetical protein KQH40_00330 [bacterium]|nr:hypothetical protein [bacterium]